MFWYNLFIDTFPLFLSRSNVANAYALFGFGEGVVEDEGDQRDQCTVGNTESGHNVGEEDMRVAGDAGEEAGGKMGDAHGNPRQKEGVGDPS